MPAILEHSNFTVSDPDATAAWMCEIFGWHIRWSGASKDNGYTVHVGSDDSYLALYRPDVTATAKGSSYTTIGGLNHIALIVEDLDASEQAVKKAGFTPGNHGDYEPGRRFYFHDADRIEYELVQYEAP
ncbi:VOC family protein [Parasedimentitalea psychrophila]|uniref:VOC family protein n=1 Tax=Parasedimentitalea psychrophila TaxID=2997337 RepID=A0A9Y2P250_9RHOB|nr:VOC family protein [Parasedimentitalea psychrophila]WIY26266.1 VOC family protein [Parasedimentitalea psychrophila]